MLFKSLYIVVDVVFEATPDVVDVNITATIHVVVIVIVVALSS